MERMRLELKKDGLEDEVAFVAINAYHALDDQEKLIERCSFPLLQDVAAVNAWTFQHQGKKDDIYVYDQSGTLLHYLPIDGEVSVNLSSEEGYDNLKSIVLDAIEG